MGLDLLKKREGTLIDQINNLSQAVQVNIGKSGGDPSAAKSLLRSVKTEVKLQFDPLIEEELKPKPPRTAKKILRDALKEVDSPALKEEITKFLDKADGLKLSTSRLPQSPPIRTV